MIRSGDASSQRIEQDIDRARNVRTPPFDSLETAAQTNHDVEPTQCHAPAPEFLANDAAQRIAIDRAGQEATARDQSEASLAFSLARKGEFERTLRPLAALEEAAEDRTVTKPGRLGEAVRMNRSRTAVGRRQTQRRARPLARRARRTLRPPTVFMRARKPWVRLRLTTEGWYVRFMVGSG